MLAAPFVPVLVIDRVEDALPVARALVLGGLPVLEVTRGGELDMTRSRRARKAASLPVASK